MSLIPLWVLTFAGVSLADQPIIDIEPSIVRFGVQLFDSSTTEEFTITARYAHDLLVTVEELAVGSDFSPGQNGSTCPLGVAAALAHNDTCVHAIAFTPTENFAGRQVAMLRVTATALDGTVLEIKDVNVAGFGVARDRTIDFTAHGAGPLDPDFYDPAGISFVRGDTVEVVEGDEALVGPVRWLNHGRPGRAIVTFAPTQEGTAEYRLAAHGTDGTVVAETLLLVEQDSGVVGADPLGYVTIELPNVPYDTRALALTNQFIGSSWAGVSEIGFAVSTIQLFADPL